jgi:hypothetical protein
VDTGTKPLPNGYQRVNEVPMRRALVLTDESARHPFRASLPPQSRELRIEAAEPRVPWRMQLWGDVRGFAQAYCACFAAVTAFIF